MQEEKAGHVCDPKELTSRYQSGPIVFIQGMISFLFALYNLYLLALIKIKRIKKAAVYRCSICGRYEWKCPYCNAVEVMDTVPRLHKCKECDKTSTFDPYLNSFVFLFQNGKKPSDRFEKTP